MKTDIPFDWFFDQIDENGAGDSLPRNVARLFSSSDFAKDSPLITSEGIYTGVFLHCVAQHMPTVRIMPLWNLLKGRITGAGAAGDAFTVIWSDGYLTWTGSSFFYEPVSCTFVDKLPFPPTMNIAINLRNSYDWIEQRWKAYKAAFTRKD